MNWTCGRCRTSWSSKYDEHHAPDCPIGAPNIGDERLRKIIREEIERLLKRPD